MMFDQVSDEIGIQSIIKNLQKLDNLLDDVCLFCGFFIIVNIFHLVHDLIVNYWIWQLNDHFQFVHSCLRIHFWTKFLVEFFLFYIGVHIQV